MSLALFLNPSGRIRRGQFWIAFLIVMVLSVAAGAVPFAAPVLGLALVWPQLVIHIKRLHDIGWSGWLLLLPAAVSLSCMTLIVLNGGSRLLVAPPNEIPELLSSPEMHTSLLFFEISFAVEAAFLLWVGSTKGQPEANRFGPPPATAA